MATKKKEAVKKTSPVKVIKSQNATENIVVNNMPIILRSIDRQRKDIGDWWNALKVAEQPNNANRVRLYDIYATVLVDAHLAGIKEKRIASIINKEIYFEKAGKKVDELKPFTESSEFRRLLKELMNQKFWGITGVEFVPGADFTFNVIPRKHIKIESQIITKEQYDLSGVSYEDVPHLWVIGERDDFGLLLQCTPLVMWKKATMGDWAQYIEIFGQPVIIAKYDGFNEKTKIELNQMMEEAGSSLRMQMPKGVDFQMLDGKTSNGNGDLQQKFVDHCNQELSVMVLGATGTTNAEQGSGYAQSKTHAKQQQEILKADMIDMKNLLNSQHFIDILKSYGLPVDGGAFCFEQDADIYEMQAKLSIVTQVAKMEPVSADYIYEISNVPKPENYDALKEEMKNNKVAPVLQPPVDEGTEQADENSGNQTGNDVPTPSKVKAALKKYSFFQKLNLLFSEAP
jgi:Protein of unknown function (DUF935)